MRSPLPTRFRDDRTTSWSFINDVSAPCPRCGARTLVVRPPGDTTRDDRVLGPRRLVCPSCGYTRDHPGLRVVVSPGRRCVVADPFLSTPLWPPVPTRPGGRWAYNQRVIERFVAANIREHADPDGPGRRMTMIGQLPFWLQHRGHRKENLRNAARRRDCAWAPHPAARLRGSRSQARRSP